MLIQKTRHSSILNPPKARLYKPTETSAKLRPLTELMSAASLTLQRHMSVSNLSPRNIGNIPAG